MEFVAPPNCTLSGITIQKGAEALMHYYWRYTLWTWQWGGIRQNLNEFHLYPHYPSREYFFAS